MSSNSMLFFLQHALEPDSRKILHVNATSELVCILSGQVQVAIQENVLELSPHSVFLLPPKQFFHLQCEEPVEFICVGFDGPSVEKPLLVCEGEKQEISSLLRCLETEFTRKNPGRQEMMDHILGAALLYSLRLADALTEEPDEKGADDNFSYIVNYLDAKSQDDIDMEQVAAMAGLSYHRFRHRFKELSGVSPQQYVIRRRIDFAKELLETTSFSTTSIAQASGFRSVPQFITCFSKQEGITPVRYRRSVLAGRR